jgi:ligand-binding sensor domain-containing protein
MMVTLFIFKKQKMNKLARIFAMVVATLPLWAMNGGPVIKSHQQDGNSFVVRAVHVDEFGVKWFGTSKGLLRYDGKEWLYYTGNDHLMNNEVLALEFEQAASGPELWVATVKGVSVVAYNVDGVTAATSYTMQDGLLNDSVSSITVDTRNNKFFGSEDGIIYFHSGIMDTIRYADYIGSMVNKPVNDLAHRSDSIYIAQNGGIGRLISGVDAITGASRWTSEYGISPLSGNINCITIDSKGHQWFGTDEGAEEHIGLKAKENWILYTTGEGLVNNFVESISEDDAGGMWFGTRGGVSRLFDDNWISYTVADGLASDTVYDVAFDADTIWMATRRGISSLVDGQFSGIYTSSKDKAAAGFEMKSSYHPGEDAILLSYSLPRTAQVEARLYGIDGSLVGQWNNLPGFHGLNHVKLPLAGHGSKHLESGIYILRMAHGGRADASKLVIIR